jgi:hypothetical protein
MARVVTRFWYFALSIGAVAMASSAACANAQSDGWGEPIAPPAKPEPPPPAPPPARSSSPARTAPPSTNEPNPDWADLPPSEYEERSAQNPDWVEEAEPPPVGHMKRAASEFYDPRYANRDLTMPRGMMRGTFDTVVGRRVEEGLIPEDPNQGPFGPTGTISTMNFGVAITLAQDFEIGFSRYRMGSFPSINVFPAFGFGGEGLITFSMSPEAKFGDIPFYARFQVLDRDTVKMAIDAVFRIPSRTSFGFLGGIPLRFIIQERFTFDTAFEMVVDDNPQGPSVWSLNVPLKFVANATDALFLEVGSGMTFFDLSQTIRTVTSGLIQGPFYLIPLGARVGYTVEARATMMDLFVSFRFPALYRFTTRANEVDAETWQVMVGFNVYSPILFKRGAL